MMNKSLNILLVDNDPAQVRTLSLFLESEGLKVAGTTDFAEALELIKDHRFDLLIADLMMPEIDGVELVKRCREHQRGLRAILITGHEDKLGTFGEQVDQLFSSVLPKPLDIDALISEIVRITRYGGFSMRTKELQEHLAADMESWMKIEDTAVSSTGAIIEKTGNPVIRIIMEIIQRDSLMHHRVQEFIRDTLTKESVVLNTDEMADVWDMIEKHIEIEKRTVQTARQALEALKGTKMVVQEYLLNYLMMDEEKHDKLLETLSTIKKGLYPYG
jgi:CheY-like chemotaxis protein